MSKTSTPTTIQSISVKAGGEHTLLQTPTGHLLSAGACGLGWCRLLSDPDPSTTPLLFQWKNISFNSSKNHTSSSTGTGTGTGTGTNNDSGEPISLFHASYYHNLAVGANTGSLYSWGCGTFTEGGMDGVIPALGMRRAKGRKVTNTNASVNASVNANANFNVNHDTHTDTPTSASDNDVINLIAREDRGGNPELVPIPNINVDPIVDIAGGAYHSVVLQQSGKILTFGAAQLGQLGRAASLMDQSGLPVDPYPRPAHVDLERNFSGSNDDTAFDENGSAGSTTQTGSNTSSTISNSGVSGTIGTKITRIGAGFYNTFAICNRGKLYCTGENQNKQCGTGPKNIESLSEVEEISKANVRVADVSGGYCHTLVRTVGGDVITMGCGDDGQRGDGRPPPDDDDDDDNDNDNDDNQDNNMNGNGDGSGSGSRRSVATFIELPGGVKAKAIAAGANHSVILGNDGVAYTFGANDVGQCGVKVEENRTASTSGATSYTNNGNNNNDDDNYDNEEDSSSSSSSSSSLILSPTPVSLPGSPDKEEVVQISAGYAHTVLRTISGFTYVFGQNTNGQLGLGHKAAAQNDHHVDPVPVPAAE